MHILLFNPCKIPALLYGGTERVLWDLAKILNLKGHKISFLVNQGSYCDFAEVIIYDSKKDINIQIPESVDFVHCHTIPAQAIIKPYLITIHGNPSFGELLDKNCVFVSKNHAERYQSDAFVYNGLNWSNYPKPKLEQQKSYFHFLANAAWKVKNVTGAISITNKAKERLVVLGGSRLKFKIVKGMVNNQEKAEFMQNSKGLVFPVLWNEPFGLAVIESLFFGCPIFATPYGSLSELVNNEVGFLTSSTDEMANVLKNAQQYDKLKCHQHAVDNFSVEIMATNYLKYYEKVLNGEVLNQFIPTLKNKEDKYLPF
jgi:hypothetical protein